MTFERHLFLNRYFLRALGFDDLEELKTVLDRLPEGAADDGQSWFYRVLSARIKDVDVQQKLQEYDRRDFAKVRGTFRYKYFQWLALVFTEMFLDRLTDDPELLLAQLNQFLRGERKRGAVTASMPDFEASDLRRAAFFMATGSGKTLLLHAHVGQILHYLQIGKHPEALVDRADRRREFDNILLITPNEGLSAQHLQELQLSDLDGALLVEGRGGGRLFGPIVHIIEIHKLADEPSGDGVSIPLEELGEHNLVLVDEGTQRHRERSSDVEESPKNSEQVGIPFRIQRHLSASGRQYFWFQAGCADG
jgi:hypothetical protein